MKKFFLPFLLIFGFPALMSCENAPEDLTSLASTQEGETEVPELEDLPPLQTADSSGAGALSPEETLPLQTADSSGADTVSSEETPEADSSQTAEAPEAVGGQISEDFNLTIIEDSQFDPDNFQTQELHTCTKEGARTLRYALFEESVTGPYVCYLIHEYVRWGNNYHNAVKTKGYCRDQLEKGLEKRSADGYECDTAVEEPV